MFWLERHLEGWWLNGSDPTDARVPVIVLGAIDASKLLVCRGDSGDLNVVPMDKVKIGWRYNFDEHKWIDLDHPEETDLGDEADNPG